MIAIDAPVTEPTAYILSNDQENYAYLGADWLFEQLGGEGDVVYMRGARRRTRPTPTATPASSARSRSIPDINIVSDESHRLGPDAGQAADHRLPRHAATPIDGVWTSGIDNVIVDAFKTAGVPFVPIVGADNVGVRPPAAGTEVEGLDGAAVTNPGLDRWSGRHAGAPDPQRRAPEVRPTRRCAHARALRQRDARRARPPSRPRTTRSPDPTWPVGITVAGWTTYTKDELLACRGPGE